MMRLLFLVANQAYVFTFGTDLVRMGDGPMFHPTRREAIEAARRQGLTVARNGSVEAA